MFIGRTNQYYKNNTKYGCLLLALPYGRPGPQRVVEAFLSIGNYDIMISNETFLNSEVQIDDPRWLFPGKMRSPWRLCTRRYLCVL